MLRNYLLQRVALPAVMLALLFLSLAYWWLDNVPHELFGTGLFGFLCRHIYLNRAWFRHLGRGTYDGKRIFEVTLHSGLIVNMAVLSMTSVAISQTVFAALPIPNVRHLREIHWFSAYWVVIVTGLHVGLHWERLSAGVLHRFGVAQINRAFRVLLWGVAAIGLLQGVAGFRMLNVWTKLTFNYSLEFWDFTDSVAPFFGHWLSVFLMPAILTHLSLAVWRQKARRSRIDRAIRDGKARKA